jgi:hypothetical protein
MKQQIAVCLLTCNRDAYTEKTVQTFAQFNAGDDRFVLLHGDDASDTPVNAQLAGDYGFTTVMQSTARRGWLPSRIELFRQAARYAQWVLLLENDIETLRPFPWKTFDVVWKQRDVTSFRLYGRFKDRQKTELCLATHKRNGHTPVNWRPWRFAPEPCQIGRIHWSAQPCVTRLNDLLDLHRHGHEPHGLTVRVKKNVMAHFGTERTTMPGLEGIRTKDLRDLSTLGKELASA